MAVATPKLTTSTQEAKNVKTYWNRALLERAKHDLIHHMFGNDEGVPKGHDSDGSLTSIEWLRAEPITVPTPLTGNNAVTALYTAVDEAAHDANTGGSKLTQGSDPTDSGGLAIDRNITITAVTATPDQYGAYYIGTDRMKRAGLHSFREMVTDILGQNAGEVTDLVVRNGIYNNMSLQYAGTANSVATVAPAHLINYAEVVEVVKTLKANRARPVKNGHFVSIITPSTWATLMLDPDFREAVIYGGKDVMFSGMINKGRVPWLGVEFYETPITASQAGSLTTVHSTFFIAKDAYGVVKLQGMGLENIFHDVGSAGSVDPLNLRWTQAWKGTALGKVLNSAWGVELRHAVAV